MRVYNDVCNAPLHKSLMAELAGVRARRQFDPVRYVEAKTDLLNAYLRAHGLKAVVVGVSGGVDSAVALGIVAAAAAKPDSPIEKITALTLPIFDEGAATNQPASVVRAKLVTDAFGVDLAVVDLSAAHAAVKASVDDALRTTGQGWAAGQLVSYLRTPALYYATSLLAQAGLPGLVCGTTNKDEGSWLGYFGKASDGMVDVQLIADIHKSEVVTLARALGVPDQVADTPPAGDMFDGRLDEQVFGAPYDFVELHLAGLAGGWDLACRAGWDDAATAQYDTLAAALTKLHTYNAHKYLAASPAVHLDVLPARIDGGWVFRTWEQPGDGRAGRSFYDAVRSISTDPDIRAALDQAEEAEAADRPAAAEPAPRSPFVAEFGLDEGFLDTETPAVALARIDAVDPSAGLAHGLLSPGECDRLTGQLRAQRWVPVGRNGMRGSFDPAHDQIGSWRATAYSETFANQLWRRLSAHVDALWDPRSPWRPVGINPAMRFIRYDTGGELVAHYDAPHDFSARRTTKLSVVIYLAREPGVEGGATRFLTDPQTRLPERERDYGDWDRLGDDDQVLVSCAPAPGAALIFKHRLLHDGQTVNGTGSKLLLRTDVIFERG